MLGTNIEALALIIKRFPSVSVAKGGRWVVSFRSTMKVTEEDAA